MKLLRLYALIVALLVAGGEVVRSWGDRPVIMWLDDFLVAAALIASAAVVSVETVRRRAAFAAAWGFAVGIIYISFFDKVIGAAVLGPGAEFNRINIFVTFSLMLALAGLVASLLIPLKSRP